MKINSDYWNIDEFYLNVVIEKFRRSQSQARMRKEEGESLALDLVILTDVDR